jgi:hypothetical protein
MSRVIFQKQQFVNVAEVPCREAAQSNPGLEISLFPDSAGNKGRFAQPKIDNMLVVVWGLGLR